MGQVADLFLEEAIFGWLQFQIILYKSVEYDI